MPVAGAVTNALAGEHKSIVSGIVLVATGVLWSYCFNLLAFKFPVLHRLFHPKPKILIKDGEMQRKNMKKELIAEEELKGKLRRQGVGEISKVRKAYVESDGQISVIKC